MSFFVVTTFSQEKQEPGRVVRRYAPDPSCWEEMPTTRSGPFEDRGLAEAAAVALLAKPDACQVLIEAGP